MDFIAHYDSPLGKLTLSGDREGLTGLYFGSAIEGEKTDLPVFGTTKRWLDIYFKGTSPDFTPPLNLCGSVFRKAVWEILLMIPYGKTMTYGQIAARFSGRMAAQAVGNAVGHNPIALIVPCHRVVGANGKLTGYAGGLDKKIRLLELEKADFSRK